MKNIIYILFLVSFTSYSQFKGETFRIKHSAPELSNNIIADVNTNEIIIYLPPSYNSDTLDYPVLYFLTGFGCDYFKTDLMIKNYDELISENKVNEMILIVINGCNDRLRGGFYKNSLLRGNWEDYIIKNLIPYIDDNFRTIASQKSRGIAGHSMGGYGAFNLLINNPNTFGAVYINSPGLFNRLGLHECQMFSNDNIIEEYFELEEDLSQLSKQEAHQEFLKRLETMSGDLLFTISYGMCNSPNKNKNAPYIDYPYKKHGESYKLLPEIWKKWTSGFGSLYLKIMKYRRSFFNVDSFVIDYGSEDYYKWIPKGCEYFSGILDKFAVPHKLLKHEHGHTYYPRYKEIMFPQMSKNLNFN
jgi:hypothetical protein